jgi:hypothetical protein
MECKSGIFNSLPVGEAMCKSLVQDLVFEESVETVETATIVFF